MKLDAITKPRTGGIPIGALSRRTGVNIETIRYYERIALLPAPPRTPGGRRAYGPDETKRLIFIRRSRELGFSISDIRSLIDLGEPERASCTDVCAIAAPHLDDVRARIADLQRLETLLARTMSQCAGGGSPDCGVLEALCGTDGA